MERFEAREDEVVDESRARLGLERHGVLRCGNDDRHRHDGREEPDQHGCRTASRRADLAPAFLRELDRRIIDREDGAAGDVFGRAIGEAGERLEPHCLSRRVDHHARGLDLEEASVRRSRRRAPSAIQRSKSRASSPSSRSPPPWRMYPAGFATKRLAPGSLRSMRRPSSSRTIAS